MVTQAEQKTSYCNEYIEMILYIKLHSAFRNFLQAVGREFARVLPWSPEPCVSGTLRPINSTPQMYLQLVHEYAHLYC